MAPNRNFDGSRFLVWSSLIGIKGAHQTQPMRVPIWLVFFAMPSLSMDPSKLKVPTGNSFYISSSSNFFELIRLIRSACKSPCPQFGRCSDICVWLLRISKHSSLHSYHFTLRNPNVSNHNFISISSFFPYYLMIFTRKCHDSWRQVVCRYSFIWTTYI